MAFRLPRSVFGLLVLAVAMFGFTYLMVPVYNKACEIGWIDSRREAEQIVKNTQVDTSRWIRVEFVANVNEQLPWKFEPLQTSVKIHPGELTHIAYRVTNLTDRNMIGQAVVSYGPAQAGEYIKKIECFCFTRQPLKARESKDMPVTFVVQPELSDDINTITLSYTFFELKEGAAD
jgi:cytochrome c oxidase assembly protein subunit 11